MQDKPTLASIRANPTALQKLDAVCQLLEAGSLVDVRHMLALGVDPFESLDYHARCGLAAAAFFSELVTEVAGDLGDNRLSDNELQRIEREAAELLAAVHQLLGAARTLNAEEHRP